MDLRAYLEEKDITQAAFAAQVGCTAVQIHNLVRKKNGASLPLALKIEKATRGRVKPSDLQAAGEPSAA